MAMHIQATFALAILIGLAPAFQSTGQEAAFTSRFRTGDCHFSAFGGNAYLSLNPGLRLILQGTDAGQQLELVVTTLDRTRDVFLFEGERMRRVRVRVIEERESVDDELESISRNYWARCVETGDVYFLGAEEEAYEDGELVSRFGSWETGVDGAEFGVVMPGSFFLGSRYQQFRVPGLAVEQAEHVEMGFTVDTPLGSLENCARVKEQNAIRLEADPSFKTYAPGVGLIADDEFEIAEIQLGVAGLPSGCRFTPFSSHPYFRLVPNSRKVFEGILDGASVRLTVSILEATSTLELEIAGEKQFITAGVALEETERNGRLIRVDRKFYAQCLETGDVFLLGQDVERIEEVEPAGIESSWRAGENNARAGLMMPSRPISGAVYTQAATGDSAMISSRIIRNGGSVAVPIGRFDGTISIEEAHPAANPAIHVSKTYAPGMGLVEIDGRLELTSVTGMDVPNETPALSIQETVTLSWPLSEALYRLESSSNLQIWKEEDFQPAFDNGRFEITLPKNPASKYFRLANP